MTYSSRTGVCRLGALSRIVRVTQCHTVDRHHLDATRAAGSFHTALAARRGLVLGGMAIQPMENVAIVVDDLDAAVAFFAELGMELEGKGQVEGPGVDRTTGLDGVRSEIAMMGPGPPQQAGADRVPHPHGGPRRAEEPAAQHAGPASRYVRR